MKGLCHVCLASNIDVTLKGHLALCEGCLKNVGDLEKN